MTKYKNDPTEEHDFEPDFNSTDLRECYAHFRSTDDREPLENAIELMYEKIESAEIKLTEYSKRYRYVNDATANCFIFIRNILTQ